MEQQIAFGGDKKLAQQCMAQAQAHFDADMLRAGTYGEGSGKRFKACSIGCYAHDLGITGDMHGGLAQHYALPEWLWRLRDSIFEGLPEAERAPFHVELTAKLVDCTGKDLAPVKHWIAIARIDRMLATQRKALEADRPNGVHEAIQQVVAALEVGRRAHEAAAGGNACDWSAARSAWQSERDELYAALARVQGGES